MLRPTITLDPTVIAELPVARREDAATRSDPGVFHDRFVELFDAHFHRLHRLLSRLSGEPELASDLVQDAFVRLYRRGSLPDAPSQWLITVALNLFRNAASMRSRRQRLLTTARGVAVHSDPSPPADERLEQEDVRRRVRLAVDRLPERERRMLLLRAEGYSYHDIATALAINEASVGSLLARAKRLFRETYGGASDASR